MGSILPRSFYDRETEIVAREMLGAVLECTTPHGKASGIIVETEAYVGEHDEACHAAAGRTRRTEPLYGRPGISYVYFIYGVHWCFNAVTRGEGLPSAVLVRAIQPLTGERLMRERRGSKVSGVNLTNGPGKLCAALGIDGSLNGVSLQRGSLVIRAGGPVPDSDVLVTPRIGITKAADWPLRYLVKGNQFVSKARS
jgi:DNA-3-methyladenine glycosylase